MSGAFGAHSYNAVTGKSTVYLNRRIFNNYKKMRTLKANEYKLGSKVKTNAPQHHTVIHEFSHAKWTSNHKGISHIKAGKEIKKVFNVYKKNGSKSLGDYASVNVNEFFAEAYTKALIGGKKNKYAKKVFKIANKYKL